MADPVPERNLPAVPSTFRNNPEVWLFLNALRNRVGGTTGDVIYDTETAAQATAAIEGQLLGQLAEVESKITGLVASQIEQIQEQPFDPSGLLTEPYMPPAQEALPPEELLGGFLQAANSTAPVQSVFGRTGAIVAAEGDYQLDQLGDVTISAPTARQVLTYNGTNWLNISPPTDFSTGIWSGGTISAVIGSTIFDVSAGVAQFITGGPENPVVTRVPFGPFDAETPAGLTTSLVTYLGVDINGTLIQQTTDFTPAQRRTIATLGLISHVNLTNITAINFEVQTLRQPLNQLFDLMNAIGPLNTSGNTFSAASTNLTLAKSAGTVFQYGTNFPNNQLDPHNTSLPSQSPCSIRYRLSDGTQYAITTNVDPNNYESAPGVLSAVSPSDPYTIQHIFIFPSGNVRIQYGQKTFKTMAAAIAGITTENFIVEPILASQAAFRCYLIVKQGTTNLANTADATFINAAKFGGGVESAAVGALTAQDIIDALGFTPGIGSVSSVAATAPASGFTISGSPITSSGTLTFALNDDLAAVEGLSTTGIAVRTAANTWVTRTIAAGSNISVSDGGGLSGNPTVSLNSTLTGLTSVTSTTFVGSLTGAASLNVLKAGDTMTGSLTIAQGTGDSTITLNPPAATQGAYLQLRTNSSNRWILGKDVTAESGSNAGSNFFINRYSDAGAFVSQVLSINRASGLVAWAGDHYLSKASPTFSFNASAAAQNAIIDFRTTNNLRWAIRKNNTAESGTNTGSDLQILRYDDAGAELGTTLFINRATGHIGIGTTSPGANRISIAGNHTGATSSAGYNIAGTVQSDVTTSFSSFNSLPSTQASAFTLTALNHFNASQGTIGATSAVTFQYGFRANSNLTGATNNYGFVGEIPAAANRWNLFMAGTAVNYLAGALRIGNTLAGFNGNGVNNFVVTGTDFQTSSPQFNRFSNDNDSSYLLFAKSRSATPGSYAIVQNNDSLGRVVFTGDDGGTARSACQIVCAVDGTPAAGIVPGRLSIQTANSAGALIERLRINSAGNIGIGSSTITGFNLRVQKDMTGGVFARNVYAGSNPLSDVTSGGSSFESVLTIPAGTALGGSFNHFYAQQGTFTGTAATQSGFVADSNLIGATTNYGFFGGLAAGTGRWNFFASGTADNAFRGNTSIGKTSPPTTALDVNGVVTATSTATGLGSNTAPAYSFTGDTNTGMYSSAADTLNFATNGTSRMNINSSGLVTIGPGGLTLEGYTYSLGIIESAAGQISVTTVANPSVFLQRTSGQAYTFGLNTASANFNIFDQTASASRLTIADTTGVMTLPSNVASTSPTTGTLVITGGLGVSGAVNTSNSIRSTSASGGIGYATGAGGTVTQATNKATGVTLNAVCGEITMNAAALNANTVVTFTLTNSSIAATDLLVLNHSGAGTFGAYMLDARCAAGSATIAVRNVTAGSLSEAIVIRFAVIKAVTS